MRESVGPYHRKREIAEIVIELVQVPARTPVNVREKHLLFILERESRSQLQLAICRLPVATQRDRAPFLDCSGCEDDSAAKIALKITRPDAQHLRERVFDLDVPRFAVGREVSGMVPAVNEREPPGLSAVGVVEKTMRPIDDPAA